MKFLAVFAAILAVACARSTWTLQELSEAIESPHTDATLKPYLEAALNEMMNALWAGQQIEAVTVTIPSVDVSGMTLHELSVAIQNPDTDPALLPYLETALNQMMQALFDGVPVEAAVVPVTPAMELHYYTLHELSLALQDPAVNPQLVPYLEQALNELMEAMFSGQNLNGLIVVVPAGIEATVPGEVIPAPVDEESVVPVIPVMPVIPVAPETPEIPASPVVEEPATATSPLVQIIVNINQQEASVIPAAPVVLPAEPVHVVESAPIVDPVQVVDNAPVDPVTIIDVTPVVDPVQVVDAPSVVESMPIGVVVPIVA